MRSAQELLCYSKGMVRSPESDHTETDVSPAAAKPIAVAAAAAGSSTTVRGNGRQDDRQRELLEQQLSATRVALRQANRTVEDVKAELEEARAARGAMMEELHKSTAELQIVKSELVNAKVELQSANDTTTEMLTRLREVTTEMQMLKSEWIKTRTELDQTKVKLQAVSGTTKKEIHTIKSEWAKSQAGLLNKLRSVSSKAQRNAAGVKAAKAANTQLTETSQLLLKLVLKTTRHAKNRSQNTIRSV